jgi:hypothetical protein
MSAPFGSKEHPKTIITLSPEGRLALARGLARLMDTAFEVPGTRIRFGLDAILGLIPGVGDAIGSVIGGYIVIVGSQLGVPRIVIWQMMLNLGIDAAIGVVPVVGDMLDIGWKANVKNVALIEQALVDPAAAERRSRWALVGIAALVFLLGAAGAALTWLVIWLLRG